MSIPIDERKYIIASSTSDERQAKGIIVKGTYWIVFSAYGNLHMREFEGGYSTRISIATPYFHLTPALDNSLNLLNDRFWLWTVDASNVLRLIEIEPIVNGTPIIHDTTVISSYVKNIRGTVKDGKPVVIYTLTPSDQCILRIYSNIKSGIPSASSTLHWVGTRLDNFDALAIDSSIHVAYLNISSPPNVYSEDYDLSVPEIINCEQIGILKQVQIEWNEIVDTESYRLERSIDDPTFASSTVIYNGLLTSFVDYVPSYSKTYYYRVKQELPSLGIESVWSETKYVTVIEPDFADFTADVTSGDADLTVNFTDLSTGSPTSWDWDFGDGSSHSYDQNPTHVYTKAGTYTVSLTVTNDSGSYSETKTDYITVIMVAEFSASPLSSDLPPLSVSFTDESLGEPTEWEWDFGDGSPYSHIQNPTHDYTSTGSYTVGLYVSSSGGSDDETKTNYITIDPDRYWVATSTRYWDSTSYWSRSSGGSGGASVPISTTIAHFDEGGPGDCIFDTSVSLYGLRVDSSYAGMILQGSKSLTVGLADASFSGGSFLGGTAPIIINGSVNIDGGEVQSTSNLLTVEGDFVYEPTIGAAVIPSKIMVEEITLSAEDATNKYVFLMDAPTNSESIVLNIIGGAPQNYGTDYTTISNILSWSGMDLDSSLASGDNLRVIYESIAHYPGGFFHNHGTVLLKANDTLFHGGGIRLNNLTICHDGTDKGSLTVDTSSHVENLIALESGYFIHGSDATVHVEKDLTSSPGFGSRSIYKTVLLLDGTGRQEFRYAGGLLPTVITDKYTSEQVMASGTGPISIMGNFNVVDGTFNCGGLDVNVGSSIIG